MVRLPLLPVTVVMVRLLLLQRLLPPVTVVMARLLPPVTALLPVAQLIPHFLIREIILRVMAQGIIRTLRVARTQRNAIIAIIAKTKKPVVNHAAYNTFLVCKRFSNPGRVG
jgi:hypothetical protein